MKVEELLLERLTPKQKLAVQSTKRLLLVVAGAGSGKTEVMARRIAWWVAVEKIQKERIVAFTFTERAAEEMKFRIRSWVGRVTPQGEEVSLGNMYVGTIHGFCLAKMREFWPDRYHNYDILDERSRAALILRGFHNLLALGRLRDEMKNEEKKPGQYAVFESFIHAYDQLHENNQFEAQLSREQIPIQLGAAEHEWCKKAALQTDVGDTGYARAFAESAARYFAYLHCRRFLDFSSSQTEFTRSFKKDPKIRDQISEKAVHLVVDEIQDINPVQKEIIDLLVGKNGSLTAVGDHRQSIYGFRGAKVQIIADLWEKLKPDTEADVIDLQENFRSTPRIINLANKWAQTISRFRTMETPPMKIGNEKRKDYHPSHIALTGFETRLEEASWIAEAIRILVPSEFEGATHDKKTGTVRGLALSDIAVLIRSSTDARTYMEALESAGIPAVVRAGPDLFSQPEVLFFIAAFGISAGISEFYGSEVNPKSLPKRIEAVLGCAPKPEIVLKESAKKLRQSGLAFDRKTEEAVLFASQAIYNRIRQGVSYTAEQVMGLRTPKLREFLSSKNQLRRVFPQQIFHFLLAEARIESWDTCEGRGQTALFHLGAISQLVTGIETPGWTSVADYSWQIIGLCQFGAEEGRAEEQPLMVQPDAVTICTIHAVKGLEFAAIFLADVNPLRFPSSYAKRIPRLPMSGAILESIDASGLADNDNYDGERRLMYVALTRSERFLFLSHSGRKTSRFIKELRDLVESTGGTVTDDPQQLLHDLKYSPKEYQRDLQLSTSFSDLRYYIACPHDFYLRKVLGFAPTIDQAFGYGRGVHNLLRALHSDPKKWAALAKNRSQLEMEIQKLINQGLFYLRYTTGDPAENMRRRGRQIVADYVQRYAKELLSLEFEPEKAFETLIEYEEGDGGALISGAIDVVRQDDPPRVTLIDFKSGDPDSDRHKQLDEQEMKLQVAIYAIGAKKELEYQPEQGLVRYLGATEDEKQELNVPLNEKIINQARKTVSDIAGKIRSRQFNGGPKAQGDKPRCAICDFMGICGLPEAVSLKQQRACRW